MFNSLAPHAMQGQDPVWFKEENIFVHKDLPITSYTDMYNF